MATRTNFYKTSSSAYNKQLNLNSVLQNLNSYNIATGNATPEEPPATGKRKLRHDRRPPSDQRIGAKENEGPMSHQEYIEKRRKEADASQPYQELTAGVLESSSSALNLVVYESDECSSADSEEDHAPRSSKELLNPCSEMQYFPVSVSTEDADHIKTRYEQRYAAPGEPVCIICGNYGEYICNETSDDICSMECKVELLQRIKLQKEAQSEQPPVALLSARRCTLEVPEYGGDTWDYDRHCWSKKTSGLCTYECWKCKKPGHLPEDCLGLASSESSSAGEFAMVHNRSSTISRDLLDLYKRCRKIGKNFLDARCNSCRGSTALAACLGCRNNFCDCCYEYAPCLGDISLQPMVNQYGEYEPRPAIFLSLPKKTLNYFFARCSCYVDGHSSYHRYSIPSVSVKENQMSELSSAGHLSEHIRENPTHQQYYSYKLRCLVKCCKSTCQVTSIKDLLACHYCFDKAFDKFYDMYSATWKPSGLSIISNSICCEDHFEWHRMNCLSANVEDNAYILKNKDVRNKKCAQLSDFIF